MLYFTQVLDLSTWEWVEIEPTGELPEPRSGHQTVVVKDALYVCGGWNSVQQFDDLFILDTKTWAWSKADCGSGSAWGPPRWNHSAVGVFAVPHWKVFVFGGNSGNLAEGGNPQGDFRNDLCVLNTGSNTWTATSVVGELPEPRSDTQITGMGFSSTSGSVNVRFACPKGFVETEGRVVNDTEVSFHTPSFEKFGPMQVECRLSIGPKGLTNTKVNFQYFSVGDATKTVAFGPGLLHGTAPAVPVVFMIQARDKIGNDRVCGMDEFRVEVVNVAEEAERLKEAAKAAAKSKDKEGEEEEEEVVPGIASSIQDNMDGTYLVSYTPPSAGEYRVSVEFLGTFQGIAGPICGSPFTSVCEDGSDPENNSLNGPLLMSTIKDSTKELKDYSTKTLKGLKKNIPKDDRHELIKCKEYLKETEARRQELDLRINANRAALFVLRKKGEKNVDRLLDTLDNAATVWTDVKAQAPTTQQNLVPLTKLWSEKTEEEIEAYQGVVKEQLKEFKVRPFWEFECGAEEGRKALGEAEDALAKERKKLDAATHLCALFEFPDAIKESQRMIADMESNCKLMYKVWDVCEELQTFIQDSKEVLWSEVTPEALEDDAKTQMKNVKAAGHKDIRWCGAYKAEDKLCKDFLNTIPLISLLGNKAMRPRHWMMLMKATGKDFVPPYQDPQLKLGGLLALNLHEFSSDVEEIADQAIKEEKMEVTLAQLAERWNNIVWGMDPYKGGDVPLLKMAEEDFEALEADQLVVQGMMASRYLAQFEEVVSGWQTQLSMVSDVFTILQEIQRTWSYLEPLFIGSEEVKKELPEDAKRFEGIDTDVKALLKSMWEKKSVRDGCNTDGYLEKLESIQEQLELCKKSLADFLDGRRRQFPRYYFVSEADLLDILSNGSDPNKILVHTPKVYLCCKTLVLGDELMPSGRPKAVRLVSGVGSEEVEFEPAIPLEGKVEIYMQDVLDVTKASLYNNLKRSLSRYSEMSRPEWLMHKNPTSGRPSDPAQIILLTLAINYVSEVEAAFIEGQKGKQNALTHYNKQQIDQLNDLIRLTQSDLTKGDRTRVMVCITMDAHGRDVVQKMAREGVTMATEFQWQSQLKHKWRVPPPSASFQNRDPQLRGPGGERAEIAIADATLPYDYEYLGNGPRLVITPLTDRIYVTATQALNLKMGCAPAGPAGTGKTESTKDLANALAKCCYVFNCSPEMDYQGLGNIFKGLASSGAWGCFDEFNRLIPEVLSVCSVQFKAVCDGVKAEAARIVIEGDEVSLDPTCGAYITMNPGYLGRSELPEGLKALFRPMTVMVPDLVLICENMLMAEGFIEAKVLASKFYGLYSLLRELLSKQMHYDWGLRAVKSVLVVAGAFKRAEPELAEDALLMRALRDFNIPKIVREDEVVFFGLLGDLFPGQNPPRKVDEELEHFVVKACEVTGNHPDDLFCLKVVQLEELLQIRHCVFVMGPPGAGKSQSWKTLAAARKLRTPDNLTKIMDVNPKSIKTEELYGFISMATREWKDGLLSKVMRDLGNIPDEKPKWILLDGDLDANWIESMNSVMDDNRMLTLASNERIPLKSHMRMIFEIRDLKYATPATVSRAGILYISTDDGTQWVSLIQSWLKNREEPQNIKDAFQGFFDEYVGACLLWMKINVMPIVPVEDMALVQVLLYMMDGLLTPANTSTVEELEKVFVFCMIWAMGSALTVSDDGTDYQKLFSDWWRGEWKKVKFPSRETVFDYWLDPETGSFEQWTKSPYFFSIDYDSRVTPMTQITVPTPETCSVTFWMQLLVKMRKPVMMAGPSGTGKTQMVMGMLKMQNPDELTFQSINFNFYTTSAVLQNTMGLPLEKKTGTNFGPPGNSKLVYFLDDLNLSEVDPYNTQSAIALLRQHMEYEHQYDLAKLSLKNIANTQVVACMNPTAGSFLVNPRLQRWFATFAIGLPGPTSLLTIYQTILDGHLQHFDPEIAGQSSNMIKAALGLHNQVAANFRKTATNFHYEFNIRHLSNVFQGLLVAQPDQFKTAEKFVLLWMHESERVYGDRLVSTEDLSKYNALAQQQSKKLFPSFNMSKFYAAENADPLVFCHFAENIQDQIYDQVTSLNSMSGILEDALREYNETYATMDLVLFEDAMKHVARIVRIVLNDGGHALLVGVGGSGKQSLSRLAAFICGYSVSQIVISSTYSINDLKEDLKTMYNKAGNKDEGLMFLLTDSQITNERFLIYINDLLASGNIPDLFAVDEVDSIVNNMTSKVKAEGLVPDRKNCWEFFIKLIRKNLHVVLAFSPVGDDFRNRAKKFPALVNCTVIDWFQPWPRDALFSVGRKFLSEMDLGSDGIRAAIERFLPLSFKVVNTAAEAFKAAERRHVYTTPKSFLELLKLYNVLLSSKRESQDNAIERLTTGLHKLRETKDAVTSLEEDLKIKLEDAEQKKTVAEGIAETVSREKAIVEVETAKAQVQAEQVAKTQAEVSIKQRDTEADLAKAEPAVEAAMAALDTLNKKDLGECKTMGTPPKGVDDVFAATMVLLAGTSPSVITTKAGKVKDRSWDAAKKQLLGDIGGYIELLKGLKAGVDDNTIPAICWKEIRPFLALEHFTVDIIQSKNSAAAGVCSFVLNIVMYYDIVVTVEPKRLALAEANEQLNEANSTLKQVQEQVAELEAKLAKLTAEFNAANKDKQEALESVSKGQRKLDLAQRLTGALSSENDRWAENVIQLRADMELLTGDVLLAAAFISYVGPFTKTFRDQLMGQEFLPFLQKEFQAAVGEEGSLPMSADPDPIKTLTTDAEVAGWNSDGLPNDQVSTENGAIVTNSARWPLIIDPQLQGIKWIRTKEASPERNLEVVRLGQPDMLRKLEKALENGHSILIENLGETLEAVLTPVIQRAVIYRGRKMYIKLGDSEVEFHPDFRLFLHTKLSNPHFPPEIQAETTLINFTVTMRGLEDQLLNLVVRKERPDLADLGEQLVEQQNGFKIKMKELEDNILYKLATAEGDITEDVELIEGLEETKRIATDIEARSALAKETQVSIRVTSEKYRPVANRSSLLFFLMNDLVKIHSYYIYSLAAFTKVFYQGIDKVSKAVDEPPPPDDDPSVDGEPKAEGAEGEAGGEGGGDGAADAAEDSPTKEDDDAEEEEVEKVEMTDEELAARCVILVDAVTTTVFNYVRRGLFERDKLTVATMLTLKILVNDGILGQEEVDYLVMSKASMDPGNMGPLGEWLPETIWPKLKSLERIKRFQNIGDAMQSDSDDWQAWFDDEKADQAKLPGEFEKSLNAFDRLILLRAMRPDRVSTALAKWIGQTMGTNYVLQQPYNMAETYIETSPATPMFFVLFPGVDPTPWVESLARTLDITTENGKFINISMGQGQEKPAEGVVERFARDGGWVLLQNCHLMQSWVPSLERLLEIVQQGAHDTFRCFISAEPPPMASMKNMPESLMQSCIKVANEAPADIKSNLTRAWANFNQEKIDGCNKPTEYKACLFSLCWFHSIVLGRRRFGPQGWSRPYSFNTGDLTICANVLGSYLNDNPQVPWDDLRYIFGEIMYGGHITDPWDRRTNNVYLEVLFTEGLFSAMELGPGFKAPDPNVYDFQGFLDYTDKELPAESPPQFGLHPNAEIGYLTNSCESLFKAILNIAGASGGGGGSSDSIIKDTMADLLERLPDNFEMITMQLRAKPLLEGESGPFVVVALQECSRMNALLTEIRRSLVELDKGLKGQLNMSQSMEDLATAFGLNEWPGRNPFAQCAWEKLAWPSKKNLLSEFIDMLRRIAQLVAWSEDLVTPQCVWLPGLFNPTAYLTAVMQVTARSTGSPLDKMTTETHISTFMEPQEVDYYPQDGAFVSGLYIEGARWATGEEAGDPEVITGTPCAGNLVDSRLKELLPALPVVYVKAVPVQSSWEPSAVGYIRHDPKIYEAPVYITSFRGPTYVFLATLKTEDPVSKWTLTGTAVLLQTDD
ncbi:Dynein heavy chain family dynein heavy chain [Ectocarpus siliculosus]|uniref:Dynein heavy chain family dynein heavy chain n=1 Tax=Ectocarpus siliculosus TaxID=2880 RepID=D7FRX0_ECTSI|nr:Dynein heavy chain family dynein heavy chain [Ectocarpus siliculosus]|eukprot:CBJ30911.1 Dynein heavy chain family dynein heavy chain [Ectocarpus siliculosus]